MNKIDGKKYKVMPYTFVLPQVYDESLSYYEHVSALRYQLQSLVDQLNAKFNENNAKLFNKYMDELLDANFTYTSDDKGLHLLTETGYITGDHIYTEDDETMEIIDDDDKETFTL